MKMKKAKRTLRVRLKGFGYGALLGRRSSEARTAVPRINAEEVGE